MSDQEYQLATCASKETRTLYRAVVFVGSLVTLLTALSFIEPTSMMMKHDVDTPQLRVQDVVEDVVLDDRRLFSANHNSGGKLFSRGGGYKCYDFYARGAVDGSLVAFKRDEGFLGNPEFLPAGDYIVTYTDGCMRYGDTNLFNWTVHYDASNRFTLANSAKTVLAELPGKASLTGYEKFSDCVAASRALQPEIYRHIGGQLYLYCVDVFPANNLNGNPNPTWLLKNVDCLV